MTPYGLLLMTMSFDFIPLKTTYMDEDYARLFIDEIVRWHGIPLSTIQKDLGTQVKLTTTFNPQTDG